jgi:hypothetical protein
MGSKAMRLLPFLLLSGCLGTATVADEYAEGLIRAGESYPGARVCESRRHELLMELAQKHAKYMAERDTQGHQNFQKRFDAVVDAGLGSSAAEICAESWRWQEDDSPDQLGREMFKCWKSSRGHWSVASKPHKYFGAAMAKGESGTWYACIIVAD